MDQNEILAIVEAVKEEIKDTKSTTINAYFLAKVCNFYIEKDNYTLQQIASIFNLAERTLSQKLAKNNITKFVNKTTGKLKRIGLYDLSNFCETNFLNQKTPENKIKHVNENLSEIRIQPLNQSLSETKKSITVNDRDNSTDLHRINTRLDGLQAKLEEYQKIQIKILNLIESNSSILSQEEKKNNKSFKDDYTFEKANDKDKITFYLQKDLSDTSKKIIAYKTYTPSLFYNEAIYNYIKNYHPEFYENSFSKEID